MASATFSSKTEAQKNGNFSRRHESGAEHFAAVAAYKAKHGKEARKTGAIVRTSARGERSFLGQLKVLDERLGVGIGAKKERARLARLIEEANKKKEDNKK